MEALRLGAEIALWVWFFGCIVTYRIGGEKLVDGMGVRSAEFVMLMLFSAGIAAGIAFPKWGRIYLLFVLTSWFVIQFFCHWYYTIFGASEKKIRGYNDCFRGTLRLFPMSEKRLVPDLYHIILHILILLNIVLAALSIQW